MVRLTAKEAMRLARALRRLPPPVRGTAGDLAAEAGTPEARRNLAEALAAAARRTRRNCGRYTVAVGDSVLHVHEAIH